MSMPIRSRRATDFIRTSTPAQVGPGKYTQGDAGIVPSYAAFSSTNARILNSNNSTSAITPGPGTYGSADRAVGKQRAGTAVNTAFRSTVARIGPTAAGATPFQEPTSFSNPGPGHYTASLLGSSVSLKPLTAPGAKAPVVKPARKAPSVPRPNQCYGYEPGPNGKLIAQDAPPDVYSGLQEDTVGPAFYDPKLPDKKGTLDFARGSKRDTGFGGKRAAATPGPGHYDPGASLNTAPEDLASSSLLSQVRRGALAKSRSKRSTRTAPAGMQRTRQLESAVFRSKTPMVHNRKVKKSTEPGPGDYKVDPVRQRARGRHPFGSTVAREGWARNPTMPYTDPDFVQTPGPGSYGGKKTRKVPSLLSLHDDTPQVPFASTDERPCLRQAPNADMPGPGAYDADGGQLNLLVTSLKKRTRGRPGNFGTSTQRFGDPLSEEGNVMAAETPGPGYYNALDKARVGSSRRKQRGAVFRSTTTRFKGGMQSNAVQLVGPRLVPPPTKYNVHKAWGGGTSTRRGRTTPGFASKSRRFQASRSIVDTPGPGAYEPLESAPSADMMSLDGRSSAMSGQPMRSMSSLGSRSSRAFPAGGRSQSSFGSRQNRFHTDVHNYLGNSKITPKVVGPGRYDVSGTFVKKSFNITMTQG